ncbi:MAG: zinc ribbon domain-containing protein [Candidatus Bathyarchaeota archaeon]|nr:MAG: zinc ribbon domain-containing protein [Candidatus Bathyarchaeota archaeon]
MQTSLQAEVLLCPNCKEEVPKTLYCLNCGYPLYKIELDQPGLDEPEAAVVEAVTDRDEVETGEKMEEDEEVTITVDETPEIMEEEEFEIPPEPEVLPEIETTETVEVVEDEVLIEEEPSLEIEIEPVEEVTEEVVLEEEAVEIVETVEIETTSVEEVGSLEAETVEAIEELEMVEEITVEEEPTVDIVVESEPIHEPDPIIKEVMENFAKNISMKIKLVNLLKEDGVKTEIFNKLFESYIARGELLMNSRSETLERVRYDLESMEKALNEAKVGLEELEIRKAINDISEEEYAAKSPGYEWDIKQYKDEVGRKKAEIIYLEDITRVMTLDEITELIKTGEGCYEALDGISESKIDTEMVARVKVALEEALSCLRAS